MRFASLGSGSRGNATLVAKGDTYLLIDCGFSAREIEKRLQKFDLIPSQLTAILVTHEHGDHINGVRVLAKKHQLPIWATAGTAGSLAEDVQDLVQTVQYHMPFTLGEQADEITVYPFPVPHDAREPSQFVFEDGEYRLGLLTDTGMITPVIEQALTACDALLLEANHDADMLAQSVYPDFLKQRVGGQYGHLNNKQAANLLEKIDTSQLQHLVIMHVSEKNNTASLAIDSCVEAIGCDQHFISIAAQNEGFDWRYLIRE